MDLIKLLTTIDDDYESREKTELEKCHDFIEYSHNKINRYNEAMDKILKNITAEMSSVNLGSDKIIDTYKFKTIKKKCAEALFWVTKSHELLAVLSNYYKIAKYEEKDIEQYKNATQRLYITDKINFESEYPINSTMSNTSVSIMNLGHNENRNLKITIEILNSDLGISIQKTMQATFICKRMSTQTINLPAIQTPAQQCRANFILKIQNEKDEVVFKEIIDEIFFRKEGN